MEIRDATLPAHMMEGPATDLIDVKIPDEDDKASLVTIVYNWQESPPQAAPIAIARPSQPEKERARLETAPGHVRLYLPLPHNDRAPS
jgi:hypothetical protein